MNQLKQSTGGSHSHTFHVNMFLVLSLTVLLTVVSSAYLGPRYGKRDFDGEILGRFVPRSDSYGSRHIQVRSGARFYPGTRFGGKRSYWAPKPSQADFEERSGSPNLPETPYDCFYIPQIGVRCTSPDETSSWAKHGEDISRREDNHHAAAAAPTSSKDERDRGEEDIVSTNDASPLSMGAVGASLS